MGLLTKFLALIGVRIVTLSADTQAKIDKALASKDTAASKDADHQAAADALAKAVAAEDQTKQLSLEAHQQSAADAHDALAALAAEFGVPLS